MLKLIMIFFSFAYFSLVIMAQDVQSEFIKVAADNWHFETAISNTGFVPFGTNYYDPESYGTSELWDNHSFTAPHVIGNFDSVRTRNHFEQLHGIGVNVIRIFLSAIKFEPTLYTLDEASFQKVDKIIALAKEYDLRIIFDLVEMWEGAPESSWISWDPYANEVTVKGLEYLVTAFGERYRNEPAIFAWDLMNEPFDRWSDGDMDPLWGTWVRKKYITEDSLKSAWPDYPLSGESWESIRVPAESVNNLYDHRLFDFQLFREDVGYTWTYRLVRALRAADPNHMITIGLVQESAQLKKSTGTPGGYPGFNPMKLAPLLDYVSVHGYNWWDEHVGTYIQGLLRYCYANKPVLLEEFEYHSSTVDATQGSASGWVCWAAYQGPFDADAEAFLFDSDGTITTAGMDFESKAPSIDSEFADRLPDDAVIDADLLFILTDGSNPDSMYNRYIGMQGTLSGPLGFNILNLKPPITTSDTTFEEPLIIQVPHNFEIISGYPNPFSEETIIQYELFDDAFVVAEIYDILGKKIKTMVSENQPSGVHTTIWNGKDDAGSDVPSGTYLYYIYTDNFVESSKLILK
jgi:hypothetical protein